MAWLMRTPWFFVFCVVPLAVSAGGTLPAGDLPDVVARINSVAITRADFEARLAQSRSMNPGRFDAMAPEEKVRAIVRALNGMIQRELEVQEARRQGIVVGDAEVEREMEALKRSAAAQGGVERMLADYGITPAQWQEETRRNLLMQKLEESRYMKIPVTEDEIRREFESSWQDKTPPTSKDFDEHRKHMRMIVQQRKWTIEQRKLWLKPLMDAADIWRWTPAETGKENRQ